MSDFRTGLNLENFTRSAGAVLFFKCYHNFDWKSFDSNKVCEIKLARVQVRFHHHHNMFELSLFVYKCETDEYLPVKFSPAARDGSLSCAFPTGVTKNQKMSPNARPFSSSLQYNTKLLFSSPPYFPLSLPPPPSPVFEFHPPFAHHFVPLQLHWTILAKEDQTTAIISDLMQFANSRLMETKRVMGDEICYRAKDCYIHKGFSPRQGISSPISDLTEGLLLEERNLPPVPQESLYKAPPFDEVDIQALAHAVELTRQGAVDSLEFSKGNLFQAFQNEICRTKLNVELLDGLVREYCVYRELVEGGITSSFTSSFSLILFPPFISLVAMGRRLGVDEPLLMKLIRATLHTHNELFRLQMCKDHFEGLLKIDSLKEIKAPLIIDDVSKKNTDNSTPGSSQMTTSSSNRMVEDGNNPTQVSSGDVICDETAILKVMNDVQEKSMAAVDKISDIVENSPHKVCI
ncbi:hypothetical protein GIB67_020408 [Kingdonia uniflora]|uniref:Uncharacterized protein n=1 Tax=Kingdonia uniflora TaxID=39325 RepID=A0A7J7NVV9_9MAGN|nr:hypothetical protein GIB67_020408 [Kingdonia uniflora]